MFSLSFLSAILRGENHSGDTRDKTSKESLETQICSNIKRHLKIIKFPVERPSVIILRLYPAAFFYFLNVHITDIFVRFSNGVHCSMRHGLWMTLAKKYFGGEKIPGRSGVSFLLSHPVDRKKTIF